MKIKVIFILTSLLFSCGRFTESPIFETPQPEEGAELNEPPKKLIGIYESLVDSSVLTITEILTSRLKSTDNVTALDDYSSMEPDSITYKAPSLDKLRRFLTDEKFKDEWKFVRIEYGLQQQL